MFQKKIQNLKVRLAFMHGYLEGVLRVYSMQGEPIANVRVERARVKAFYDILSDSDYDFEHSWGVFKDYIWHAGGKT